MSFDRTKSGVVNFNEKFPSIERMTVEPENNIIKLDIFVDNSIVEIFANDGQAAMSNLVFPKTLVALLILISLNNCVYKAQKDKP